MKPNEKQEILEIISNLEKLAEKAENIEDKEKVLRIIKEKKEALEAKALEIHDDLEFSAQEGITSEYNWDDYTDAKELFEIIKEIESNIEQSIDSQKRKINRKEKITSIGTFFARFAKQKNNEDIIEELDEENEEEKTNPKVVLVKAGIVAGVAILAFGLCSAKAAYDNYKQRKVLEEQFKELENKYQKSLEKLKEMEEVKKQQVLNDKKEELQNTKEEKIVELTKNLQEKLNKYDGINVTFEQVLSLYIHLNAGNSFIEENEYALDTITRANLVKQYFVGLTKGTEEFDSYTITDADLSKISAEVFNIRNAVVNRVIVLNDEKKYEESQEMIAIFKEFITEASLKDETNEFTTSIINMQTSDKKQLKEEMYRYYNYLFAGPKSEVRNFDDYGNYVDGNNEEMTFENQGTTMRFYTWFMDVFASINLSTNIIPQDIINSAQAKLLDQATLMRMLGYKNCGAFNAYYGIDFDNAIDNRIKSNSKKTSGTNGNAGTDSEINNGLLNNSQVGSSFTTSDGSTVTVVESGDRETTVTVEPGGGGTTEDTTPDGPSEREETEGGGNEEQEEIVFEEDPTEEIIDEGGEVIQETTPVESSAPVEEINNNETIEEITFESEESTEISSIQSEINELLLVKQMILGQEIVPDCVVYIEEEKGFEKVLSC